MAYSIPQSEDDFLQMQQEAIRRVREMQQRARRTLEAAGVPIEPEPRPEAAAEASPGPFSPPATASEIPGTVRGGPVPERREEAAAYREAMSPRQQDHESSRVQPRRNEPAQPGTMFHLSLDQEQILLMVVLYLLYQDHADRWLLLALVYIVI